MIQGRDFLVLADDWGGPPSSTVHLFRQLAQHNRVFWVKMLSRMPRLNWRDLKTVQCTLTTWLSQKGRRAPPSSVNGKGGSVDQHVWPSTAVMIPWFNLASRRINRASLNQQFRQIARRFRVKEPIILTSLPPAVDFLRQVDAHPKIYYCLDDWAHYPGLDHAAYARMERELIESIDGFAATSQKLMEKGAPCRATLYLPQGVDFDHFHAARREMAVVPVMEALPRPIVGFFGLLAEWVDLEAISAASHRYPDVSFVLIGKSRVSLGDLAERENVHHIGWIPYHELPRYARYFDVGMIPFVSDQLTEAVNPLKLLEYFALGIPVVATGLPELERRDGPVFATGGKDEFCRQLGGILPDPAAHSQHAIAVSRSNTWEQRAKSFSDFLEAFCN